MSTFGNQFSASPVLTLAPHAAHHRSVTAGIRSFAHPVAASLAQSSALDVQFGAWAAAPRGRKRSRDEAAINLDSCAQSEPSSTPTSRPFGDGTAQPTVFNIQTPMPLTTPAQSILQPQAAQEDRPVLRSHKSQRLDQAAIAERFNSSTTTTGINGSSAQADTSNQPVIDDFTVHLGIGWRRISEDVDIQAAARGWARYIENHYPISSVKICLESKGLQSYLVEAAEGYFLFSENLRHGRLVGRDVGAALRNLRTSPPSFEGEEMTAGQAPLTVNNGASVSQGGAHAPVLTHADVEMDH